MTLSGQMQAIDSKHRILCQSSPQKLKKCEIIFCLKKVKAVLIFMHCDIISTTLTPKFALDGLVWMINVLF